MTTRDPSERAAAFERLFQAAEKQSRGFVPFPEHLRSVEERSTFSNKLAQVQAASTKQQHQHHPPSSSTSAEQQTSSSSSSTAAAAAATARAFCVSRVPNLAEQTSRAHAALSAADGAKAQVEAMLSRVDKMSDVTRAVRDYSERMSVNASALIAKRARLEAVLSGLSDRLRRFQKVDALHDEALSPKLVATSTRFVHMLDEIEEAAAFLAETSQHSKASSHQVYSTRLSIAYQRAMACLRDHCCEALRKAQAAVWQSPLLKSILRDKKLAGAAAPAPTPTAAATKEGENNKPEEKKEKNPEAAADQEKSDDQKEEGDKTTTTTTPQKEKEQKQQASPAAGDAKLPSSPKLQLAAPSRPPSISEAMKLIDAEFLALLQPSETAFRLVEARIGAKEAEAFVADVFGAYSDARVSIEEVLLVDFSEASLQQQQQLRASSSAASEQSSSSSFNVNGFVHNIVEMCVVESGFFQQLWVSDLSSSYVRGPLEALVTAGYSVFRSKLLHLDNVGQLTSLSASLGDIQRRLQAALRSANSAAAAAAVMGPPSAAAAAAASTTSPPASNNAALANNGSSSAATLRNELVAHAVHRFVQDTDDRLTFRISIYLRNGLRAPAHHHPSPQVQGDAGTEIVSDFVLREAIAAIGRKVSSLATQQEQQQQQQKQEEVPCGQPVSSALPAGHGAPFCLASVIRLRWLCAQLKRCASGPAAFAGFIEEAAELVIRDIGITVASWISSGNCAGNAKKWWAENIKAEEQKKQQQQQEAFFSSANFVPFTLGLRQLLMTREALLSVGAKLSTVETEFAFTSMQISKVEKDVPRIVEAPFRELCDKSVETLAKSIAEVIKKQPQQPKSDQQQATNGNNNNIDNNHKEVLRFFAAALQTGLEQSVATQQTVWRGAVPKAVEVVLGKKIKEDDPSDEAKLVADAWNSVL